MPSPKELWGEYSYAIIVVVLLVILGLVSLQLFLFAKVGGGSALSFGAGAGATLLPGYGGRNANSVPVERFAKPPGSVY